MDFASTFLPKVLEDLQYFLDWWISNPLSPPPPEKNNAALSRFKHSPYIDFVADNSQGNKFSPVFLREEEWGQNPLMLTGNLLWSHIRSLIGVLKTFKEAVKVLGLLRIAVCEFEMTR